MRVYHQIQVWAGKTDMDPLHWGWRNHQGTIVPLMTHLPPAPNALLEVIICKCKTGCSTLKCSCKKHAKQPLPLGWRSSFCLIIVVVVIIIRLYIALNELKIDVKPNQSINQLNLYYQFHLSPYVCKHGYSN